MKLDLWKGSLKHIHVLIAVLLRVCSVLKKPLCTAQLLLLYIAVQDFLLRVSAVCLKLRCVLHTCNFSMQLFTVNFACCMRQALLHKSKLSDKCVHEHAVMLSLFACQEQ
jgi:hypothetical protein